MVLILIPMRARHHGTADQPGLWSRTRHARSAGYPVSQQAGSHLACLPESSPDNQAPGSSFRPALAEIARRVSSVLGFEFEFAGARPHLRTHPVIGTDAGPSSAEPDRERVGLQIASRSCEAYVTESDCTLSPITGSGTLSQTPPAPGFFILRRGEV